MKTFDEYLDSIEIPYKEITAATNNFADENLISQRRSTGVKLYKGQLISESGQLINIVARLYGVSNAAHNEVLISYWVNHKNIHSVFKISENCDDDEILISKHVVNGSLNKYLSDSQTLTWMQRLRICVGVTQALSYLHNDVTVGTNGRSIIHGNIKSSKILLDDNWEPKLSGFRYSKTVKKGDVHRPSEYWDKSGYRDPAYNDTKCLNHKSDVFSFGVVLFEVLFGREASTYTPPNEDEDHWNLAQLARQHHEEKRLDEMIDPDLRKQMNLQSLTIFSETAYFCLKEMRSQRPDIDQVVRKLEKALQLQQKHDQTQEHAAAVESRISSHLKGKNVDHLKIRLRDIQLATQDFSEMYKIGSGGFGMVYKADLYHFDGTKSSAVKAKNVCESTKVCSTVAIKRIFRREDLQGEQGFIREIQLLSKCKHPNVVSLLGYCDEGREMILIYKYASNGSLESYLGNPDNLINLSWAQRIQICLDIAHGLNYLHTCTEEKEMIIHRDMKSANVLLDGNWVAKLSDFGLSKLRDANIKCSTLITEHVAGTDLYLDPEYMKTGKLKKASDIYSFGVVLFEMICGRLAYDPIYYANNQCGLPSIIVGRPFDMERLKKMVDPKIMEADANIPKITGGVDDESLETFITIAYNCLAETQAQRPLMEAIIKELEKSLDYQKNSKDNFQMSFSEIKLATKNFKDCLGVGRFWKLHEGVVPGDNGCKIIIVKRWDSKSDPEHHHEFLAELEVLFRYKHECIIGLAGYCTEMDERIIVYEHGYNERLHKHLDDASLIWTKRLKIGIDVAQGLDFLHTRNEEQENPRVHRDIKSASILLNRDFKAKVANLELCVKYWEVEKVEQSSSDHAYSSLAYNNPKANGFLSKESDIYSLGVVLVEMLCGRLALPEGCEDHTQSLGPLAKRHYSKKGNLNEMIFEGIKEQIVLESLNTFQMIAIQCLEFDRHDRPSAKQVVVQLNKALEFQEDIEIWEPKLPRDYKELIEMSTTPEIYSTKTKKELYEMFQKGILLQQGKLCFSISNNGDINEIIPSRMFSYENNNSHKWRSVQKSRFKRVARMLNSSRLKIKIKIKPQFLSQNVNYGAHLVFEFCNSRKVSNQPMYVNLEYKMGGETLHAYFATWRDDKWMQIELCRFLHNEKYTKFEVQLESFSRYYCGKGAVFIEGIEFRAINTSLEVQPEAYQKQGVQLTQGVQPTDNNEKNKLVQYFDKLRSESEANLRNRMLPAKMILSYSSNEKFFAWRYLPKSGNIFRSKKVAEFLSDQVFRIKCQIETEKLLSNTHYACYLIFRLAENCRGLQCPVKIQENKETKFFYFRTPSLVNLQDVKRVPKLRYDGLMEVIVWEFSNRINCHYPLNLKLKCYEGTMCGLIVHGMELRPIAENSRS